jgi:putative DNA primase/helicase
MTTSTIPDSVFESWPLEPRALEAALEPVMAFNPRWLPEALRPLCEDVADLMQVPIDFPAVIMLSCLLGCLNNRGFMRPKKLDHTWKALLNGWAAIIAPSGYMKSPLIALLTAPLEKISAEWLETYKNETETYQNLKQENDIKLANWEASAKVADRKGNPLPPRPDTTLWAPDQRRLLVSDATYEKVHVILSQNPSGIFLIRDEGAGWLAGFESPGREQERKFWLMVWSGLSYIADRIGRGTVRVPLMCGSVLCGFTPASIRYYLNDILAGKPSDDGFIQRFQLCCWPDAPGTYHYTDRAPVALESYERICRAFVNLAPRALELTFAEDAREIFISWLTQLELRIRSGQLPSYWSSHLSKSKHLMVSLSALFQMVELALDGKLDELATPAAEFTARVVRTIRVQDAPEMPEVEEEEEPVGPATRVSVRNTERAIAVTAYFESMSNRLYRSIVSADLTAAHELARHIKAGDLDEPFTARDIYSVHGWAQLKSRETVVAALAILEDRHWIRKIPPPAKSNGRPTERYVLHPKIRQDLEDRR